MEDTGRGDLGDIRWGFFSCVLELELSVSEDTVIFCGVDVGLLSFWRGECFLGLVIERGSGCETKSNI